MNQIKKKLHSDSGASLMLALALLLICLMVSSVMIVAAASGSNRNETNLQKQQEYLAVTSAAQYIADNLNPSGDARFSGVLRKNEKACMKYKNYAMTSGIEVDGEMVYAYAVPMPRTMIPGIDDDTIELEQFYLYVGSMSDDVSDVNIFCTDASRVEVDDAATVFSGPFAELMEKAASEVFLHNVSYSQKFTIDVDDERVPNVECQFIMGTDYSVTVIVKSTNAESDYSMTVEMEVANLNVNPAGIIETVTCTKNHQYFYEYCDEFGNICTSEIGTYKFQHEVSNPTTMITWGVPVISKGGTQL